MAPPSLGVLVAARTLAIDAVAGEVTHALDQEAIASLLIKGPTLLGWLYHPGEGRSYCDVDLVVPMRQEKRAEHVLDALGFAPWRRPGATAEAPHARSWRRAGDRAIVDLHRTLPATRLAPDAVWAVLSRHAEPMRLPGGATVNAPDDGLRALITALHVAHHLEHEPRGLPKARADLELAVERLSTPTWKAAAGLSTQLHCRDRLTEALGEVPGGQQLAVELGLPSAAWAREAGGDDTVVALERLRASGGMRRTAAAAGRIFVPTPDHLRWYSPLARRGRWGLAAAYLVRPVSLAARAGRSLFERGLARSRVAR